MKKILIFLLFVSSFAAGQNKVVLTGGSGGGSGTNNTNAGAFYRWLKTGTQEIKTLAANSNKINIDSVTNADAITIDVNQANLTLAQSQVTNLVTDLAVKLDETKIGADFLLTNDSLWRSGVANVRNYGAVGNGSTLDDAAFLAAKNTGKPIYVPTGYNFRLSTRLDLLPNQVIFGDGWGSIISIVANSPALKVDTGSRVTKLHFIGNGKAGSGTFNIGVFLNDAVGWSVDNCMFESFSGDLALNGGGAIFGSAVSTNNSDGGRISNNYFYSNDVGVNLATRAEYIIIINNTFGDNNTAIHAPAGNANITGNIIQNNVTGIKTITTTNPGHGIISNNLINHNTTPIWLNGIGGYGNSYIISNNMVYYGRIMIEDCIGVKFTNNYFSNIDSFHVNNSFELSMQGGWLGLNGGSGTIPIYIRGGSDNFDYLGVAREHTDSIGNFFNQYLKGTVSATDSAQIAGKLFLKGNRPASASSTDSVLVWNTTSKEVLVRAQSDIGGAGGGANTALSNLASVAINADLDPGSNNSRDIGDGTTSWKDIYAYSFNVRNGSGSGLHTSYTNYSGTPSNGLPPSTGFFVNRVSTGEASSATPTPTGDGLTNFYQLTALAANATFQTPSGSVIGEHNLLWIIIEDNGTTRTLSFNGSYVAGSDLPLPTATVAGESMELQFRCHGGTIWRLVGRTGGF